MKEEIRTMRMEIASKEALRIHELLEENIRLMEEDIQATVKQMSIEHNNFHITNALANIEGLMNTLEREEKEAKIKRDKEIDEELDRLLDIIKD